MTSPDATRLLTHNAGTLITRIDEVKPFSLHIPMVGAAQPDIQVRQDLENFLEEDKQRLKSQIRKFISWLNNRAGVLLMIQMRK